MRVLIIGWIALAAIGQHAFANPPPAATGETEQAKIARLEALLQSQQERMATLEQQVSAAAQGDADAQRTDLMRKQIREILKESEFRESFMSSSLQAGYDKGFFIKSSDDNFLMRANGVMQMRWTHYGTRSSNRYANPGAQRDDRTGFDVQRMRLQFSGHVYDPRLTYQVTIRSDAPDAGNVRLHYAFANYRFADELQFQAGIFRLASTRAQVRSDADFQFIDRPMTDAVYGLGIGTGVRVWGQLFGKRLEYYVDVVNSLNSSTNRTITPDPAEHDNNPALLAKIVWHALGENPPNDLKTDGDVEIRTVPALDIGMHYAFNEDAGDLGTVRVPLPRRHSLRPGGYVLTTTNGTQMHQIGADLAFKWMGFSTTAEYILRTLDPRHTDRTPFTPMYLLTGEDSTVAQHGAYVQSGYFLPIPNFEKKIEVAGRVGGISALAEGQEGSWEYSAALNYYIQGDKVKLQTDLTKVYEAPISSSTSSLANVNDDALIWRVQLQVAF